jgi:hypothetical protein
MENDYTKTSWSYYCIALKLLIMGVFFNFNCILHKTKAAVLIPRLDLKWIKIPVQWNQSRWNPVKVTVKQKNTYPIQTNLQVQNIQTHAVQHCVNPIQSIHPNTCCSSISEHNAKPTTLTLTESWPDLPSK